MQTAFTTAIANVAGVDASAVSILSSARRLMLQKSVTIAYSITTANSAAQLSAALTSAGTQSALTAAMVRQHDNIIIFFTFYFLSFTP